MIYGKVEPFFDIVWPNLNDFLCSKGSHIIIIHVVLDCADMYIIMIDGQVSGEISTCYFGIFNHFTNHLLSCVLAYQRLSSSVLFLRRMKIVIFIIFNYLVNSSISNNKIQALNFYNYPLNVPFCKTQTNYDSLFIHG